MHPDDIKRLAIMATLIMLCAFCPGPGRAAERLPRLQKLDSSVSFRLGCPTIVTRLRSVVPPARSV